VSTVDSNDVDEIRREMARIRREMHEDVKGVVASAEAAADWRSYIGSYPWLALGAAFAVGYFVVPRKPPGVEDVLAEVMRRKDLLVDTVRPARSAPAVEVPLPKTKKGKGLLAGAFGLLAPLALRTLQGYAAKYVENWVAQQQFPFSQDLFTPPAPGQAGPGPTPTPGQNPAQHRPRPQAPGERRPY